MIPLLSDFISDLKYIIETQSSGDFFPIQANKTLYFNAYYLHE